MFGMTLQADLEVWGKQDMGTELDLRSNEGSGKIGYRVKVYVIVTGVFEVNGHHRSLFQMGEI